MILDIHHIAIICSDYEKSKRFYIDMLGCEIIREVYREERQSYKLDLKIGQSSQIELFSFPNPPQRPSYPEACGLRHLAFRVDNVDDTRHALIAKGITAESIRMDEYTGKQLFFFEDPDGLPIEIYEH